MTNEPPREILVGAFGDNYSGLCIVRPVDAEASSWSAYTLTAALSDPAYVAVLTAKGVIARPVCDSAQTAQQFRHSDTAVRLNLRVGGYYRTAEGGMRGPLRKQEDLLWPWTDGYNNWTPLGWFCTRQPGVCDLVEEVRPHPLAIAAEPQLWPDQHGTCAGGDALAQAIEGVR